MYHNRNHNIISVSCKLCICLSLCIYLLCITQGSRNQRVPRFVDVHEQIGAVRSDGIIVGQNAQRKHGVLVTTHKTIISTLRINRTLCVFFLGVAYMFGLPQRFQHSQESSHIRIGCEKHHHVIRVLAHLLAREFLEQPKSSNVICTE